MNRLFADTYGLLAFLNPHDEHHAAAAHFLTAAPEPIVTTTWVLAELGNFLARRPSRKLFAPFVENLKRESDVTVVPADDESFDRGLELYASRADKDWSLIDCISFVVMKQNGVTDVITADHHFEQAGFTILLR